MNKARLFYIKNKKLLLKVAAITLCFVAIFCVTKTFAKVTTDYELPEYIRVALTNGFSSQKKITIYNTDIEVGYNDSDFECLETYSCYNGFYFMYNDSNRWMSDTYDDFDEMMEDINDSDEPSDLLPMYLGEDNYKIVTKPNREKSDLCDTLYDTMDSIVMISGDNKELAIFDGKSPLIKDEDDEPIELSKTKSYRGYIKLIKGISGITAVNHVDFDEYLYGVITEEMYESFDIEALKAQALAARTFAFKRALLDRYDEYDLLDSTYDQVYNGVAGESKKAIKAADETSGEVIIYVGNDSKYYGKVIDAYFSSCNGGITESSENVWTAALPYLESKEDPYEKENKYSNWTIKFTLSDLQNAMKSMKQDIGTVTGCTVTTTKQSSRVLSFNIIGTKGTYKVTKDSIRSFFTNYTSGYGYSTNFELYSGSNPRTIKEEKDNEIFIYNKSNKKVESYKLKNLYIYDNGEAEAVKVTDNVFAITKDAKNASEIELKDVIEKEDETYKLSKGEYMIVGSGFGHGIGLSQFGANDMANEGFSYDEIIKFYYKDVDIVNIK